MTSLYKEYAGTLVFQCVNKEEECGLVSKPVWVH